MIIPDLSQVKRQRMLDFLVQIKEEYKGDDAIVQPSKELQ